MELEKLVKEALYGGYSEPPRKEFVPQSSQQGYNYPYQSNTGPNPPPTAPAPERPPNLAWPLQTVSSDLSDGFVSILAAANKIENCLQQNTSISDKQKEKLKKMAKFVTKILHGIQSLDNNIFQHLQLSQAGEPVSTNPLQDSKPV